jgi:hypothetical protein
VKQNGQSPSGIFRSGTTARGVLLPELAERARRKLFFFYGLAVAAGCTMRVPVRPNDRIRDGRMQPVSVTLVDRGSMRKLNSLGWTSCAPTTAPGRFFAQESVWRLAGPERQPNCSFFHNWLLGKRICGSTQVALKRQKQIISNSQNQKILPRSAIPAIYA